jgi:hypothetical protein
MRPIDPGGCAQCSHPSAFHTSIWLKDWRTSAGETPGRPFPADGLARPTTLQGLRPIELSGRRALDEIGFHPHTIHMDGKWMETDGRQRASTATQAQ